VPVLSLMLVMACSSNDDPQTGAEGGSGDSLGLGGALPGGGGQALPGGTGTGGSGGLASSEAGGDSSLGGAMGLGGGGACDSGPLAESVANCVIEPPASTGDYHQDCVNTVNKIRWDCQCLPPLERWTEGEACADQMAEYDYNDGGAHAGFRAGICDPSGTAQCECPGWGSVESITQGTQRMESCLAMMWHEVDNPSGEQGHYQAMSNTRYTAVACGIYEGSNGQVWALQNYTR